jgi:hypothetical protein
LPGYAIDVEDAIVNVEDVGVEEVAEEGGHLVGHRGLAASMRRELPRGVPCAAPYWRQFARICVAPSQDPRQCARHGGEEEQVGEDAWGASRAPFSVWIRDRQLGTR